MKCYVVEMVLPHYGLHVNYLEGRIIRFGLRFVPSTHIVRSLVTLLLALSFKFLKNVVEAAPGHPQEPERSPCIPFDI